MFLDMAWVLGFVFPASLGLAGLFRSHALRHELLDHPSERSSHRLATPRGGGVAIVATFLAAATVLFLLQRLSLQPFLAFCVGGGMVAGVGYWDDHGHVPAPWRLLVHFVAAGLALFWLGGVPPLQLGASQLDLGWYGNLLGAVALVWLLNLYNFMDGIDGLAASETIAVAGGASLLAFAVAAPPDTARLGWLMPQLALVAAALGFLFWNWPPASLFMGDVGSGFLGYVLGVFALCNVASGILPIWSWVILLGVFLVDATLTLLRRCLAGAPCYQAHRSHAYQHAARRWGSHKRVTLAIIAIDLVWLLPMAWLAAVMPRTGWSIAVVALTPLVVLALWLGAGAEQEAG